MGSVIFKEISVSVQNSLKGLQSCERKPTSWEFYFSLVVTNPFNEKIVSTIWKGVTCCYGVGISGWLDGFINFQRNLCFGPILADRVADLQRKDDFLNDLSSMFYRESKAQIHRSRVFYTWMTYLLLTNNLKDEISQNFSFLKSRAITLKEKQRKITRSHISFNLKPCSISKKDWGCSLVTFNDFLPRIPPLWREAPCNLQILTVIYFFSDYHWTINPFDYFCFKVINIQIAQCWLLKKN